MYSAMLWVTASAVLVLLIEVAAGRHRSVYGKGEIPFIAASLGVGRIAIAPVASLMVAALLSHLFAAHKNALAGMPFWLALPLVVAANEFFFYWVRRKAHTTSKDRSLLWMIHHTHHGFGKDGASYRNFGVMLSLWDWLFGTLHIPEGRPHRYGIPGHDAHLLEELLYPLVRIDTKRAATECGA
jgi:sterol desaturase/sphingolipid hydroxylase (fatty acid hydroxylase superfamily)